jgi:xylulose-5-phosphate/fructose-6-phosphate phosphoketolase
MCEGFDEEGTTTTPFHVVVLNGLDRYHMIERAPGLGARGSCQTAVSR